MGMRDRMSARRCFGASTLMAVSDAAGVMTFASKSLSASSLPSALVNATRPALAAE